MENTIKLSDYHYLLPEDRIARYPLEKRDHSRLLFYRKGQIAHRCFYDLPDLLPHDHTLFFNNTRVIPARLYFRKPTGALIEVFLLEPVLPVSEINQAMQQRGETVWKCMIGNLKKWKSDDCLSIELPVGSTRFTLTARLEDRSCRLVRFQWKEDLPFSTVVEATGRIPLPPYLNREAESTDRERYQTVYARMRGAVAAPTAGLHFTEEVLERLKQNGVNTDQLTLHVSAGTFAPVKEELIARHVMHAEQMVVTSENIENMLRASRIAAVGTTSMRTLESLYWFGALLEKNPDAGFHIGQNDPYQPGQPVPGRQQAMENILNYMKRQKVDAITGDTRIFIYPGYRFRMCDALITNFHQPGSTLILLIAAFLGPAWRSVYEEALQNGYRFLSYGDSSLLIP